MDLPWLDDSHEAADAKIAADFAWMSNNMRRLRQRYLGRWIAVSDRTVIGEGDTATLAAKAAERERPGAEFILERIERDLDAVYGNIPVGCRADKAL